MVGYKERNDSVKKRLALLLAMVMLASVFLVACSDSDPNTVSPGENTEPPKDAEPTPLNFWTFEELHTAFYQEGVDDWNKANPDRPVELVSEAYPNQEMHNKLLI